ncbi:hypothetical protein A3SK_0112065 [Pseudomonas amygdali pv. tabaci str. 6605]|nr:hypothetical protein A3SK_0112065 [Pseudomonas amygdali pv. tabaci str. 6605]
MPTADAQFDGGAALVTAYRIDLERKPFGLFDCGMTGEQTDAHLHFPLGQCLTCFAQPVMKTLFNAFGFFGSTVIIVICKALTCLSSIENKSGEIVLS